MESSGILAVGSTDATCRKSTVPAAAPLPEEDTDEDTDTTDEDFATSNKKCGWSGF